MGSGIRDCGWCCRGRRDGGDSRFHFVDTNIIWQTWSDCSASRVAGDGVAWWTLGSVCTCIRNSFLCSSDGVTRSACCVTKKGGIRLSLSTGRSLGGHFTSRGNHGCLKVGGRFVGRLPGLTCVVVTLRVMSSLPCRLTASSVIGDGILYSCSARDHAVLVEVQSISRYFG